MTRLIDSFGRAHSYLRVSLTERCNLRCRYCMPEEGVALTPQPHLLQFEELQRLIHIFARLGVTKVRFTGGEPLLYPKLPELCRSTSAIPTVRRLAMTTNGITLARRLPSLHEAGLNALNVSLDTLQPDRFEFVTRRRGHHLVMDALRMAEQMGIDPLKINCVLMRGVNEDELVEFARMTQHRNIEVRFIEYMPFEGNGWSRASMMSFMEAVDVLERGVGMKLHFVRSGETAKLFRFDGYRGCVGFITSMTTHFCGTCNRLRLTADGNLKTCLFGDDEVSLRDPLRAGASEEQLVDIIVGALSKKHFAHGGKASPEHLAETTSRPMVRIGG